MPMRVYLDGRPLEGAGETLSSALRAATDAAPGRLLIAVRADGAPVPDADLQTPPGTAPYAATLEFTSDDAPTVVRSALLDTARTLERLKPMQAEAAARVQQGQIHESFGSIGAVLREWGRVREAAMLVSRASASGVYDAGAAREDLDGVVRDLAARLQEIKRAIEQEDWSSLGDSLAYDMDEQADRCRDWFLRAAGGCA
jgi:hypothetical protein